jgi:Ca2+-transporting ATPase
MDPNIWHSMDVDAVLNALDSEPDQGLSAREAGERLARHGPNELTHEEKASPWALFLGQFKNILIVILVIATVLSALVGEYVDAGIIMVIILFCATLGFVQEYRAERALEALKGMLAPMITVLRGGEELEVPSRELVPGDVLVLEAGDRIPADARLVEIHSLHCDEASLTGESLPVSKQLALLRKEAPVGDRRNMVFTGTTVTYGRGKAVVTSTAMQTEFGKIAKEVASVETEKTPLERRTEELGKWLGIITLAICVLVVGVSVARDLWSGTFGTQAALGMIMFAIALAVAAVPEALAAIVTGALAIAMHEMAKRNALVRKMPAVETLGCTSVICSDKTGTLTKGEMTVRRVLAGGRSIEVSGVGYAPQGTLGVPMEPGLELLLKAGLLASDATVVEDAGRWGVRGDPTEGALVTLAAKGGVHTGETRLRCPRIEEFPFSSERKRMTTVHTLEDGRRVAFMKGAAEIVLERCASLQEGESAKPLDAAQRASVLRSSEDMARDALRVLAIACKELPPAGSVTEEMAEQGLTLLGLVGMMDPPREEAIEAVKVCRQVHIRPVMITGDHKVTAVAVAREIGIYREGDLVLTGPELEQMDEAALAAVVERVSVYARVSPMDKLKIVRAWKAKGHVVAMTGDGVNDAPALKHADIGVAMGITGTDVAKEAADIVLSDDNFATIVKAIERGRWIYDNIKKYLTYLLRANITEVVVLGGVVIAMGPEFLPLLPAAILYINLATDGLPALALGLSPADPDIMKRPPRDPRESVFSLDVRTLILFGVVVECPLFLWMFFSQLPDMEAARTQVFLMFVLIELMLALNFRSLRYSILAAPPHKWLLIAIAWELLLIVVLLQFDAVRESFGIAMPSMYEVGVVLGLGLAVLVSVEVVKAVLRMRMSRAQQRAYAT